MKRALVILAGVLFVACGWAQFTGSWTGELRILPSLRLNSTALTLNYTFNGWTFTTKSSYSYLYGAFNDVLFSYKGMFGPVEVSGSFDFSPIDVTLKSVIYGIYDCISGIIYEDAEDCFADWVVKGPAYRKADINLKLEFAGIKTGLVVTHQSDYILDIPYEDWSDPKWWSVFGPKLELVAIDVGATVSEITLIDEDDLLDDLTLSYTFGLDFDGTLQTDGETFVTNKITGGYIPGVGQAEYEIISIDPEDVVVHVWLPTYMEYKFTFACPPFSTEFIFHDVCTGIQFYKALVSLTDLAFFCCDMTYDIELSFTKVGFDYVKFSLGQIGVLCCGITMDLSVEFGVNYKEVSFEFDYQPETICADIVLGVELDTDGGYIGGLSVDYLSGSCKFGDCGKITFATVFTLEPEYAILFPMVVSGGTAPNDKLGTLVKWTVPSKPKTDYKLSSFCTYQYNTAETEVNVQIYHEFEYLAISFCGAGCCGGNWTVDLKAWWAQVWSTTGEKSGEEWTFPALSAGGPGTLFGLSRMGAKVTFPLLSSFSVNSELIFNLITKSTTLTFGWSFSF